MRTPILATLAGLSTGFFSLLLVSLSACGPDSPPPNTPQIDGSRQQAGEALEFDDEDDLLDFVLAHPRGADYRPYVASIAREKRQMLPAGFSDVRITVDAGAAGDSYLPILDEVNTWKAYALFHPRNKLTQRMGSGFMRRIAPWWVWARMPAALGGNYTPEIAADCDARRQSRVHDVKPDWECGTRDGKPGVAAWYEPVHVTTSGKIVYDFTNMQSSLGEVLRAGLIPHLNISSAPSLFTGHKTTMKWYHWNEEPVRDYEGWKDFVEAAMHALDNPTLPQWRYSIVNEPNCIRGVGGKLVKVGFRGGPEDYARQYIATAEAIRRVVPGARFQVGNYVISELHPEEKNLHHYLQALKAGMKRHGDMRWSDSTFYSLSVYDVPHLSLYGADALKFTFFERFRRASGLSPLPIKVDEFDIHPDIFNAYDASHARPFFYTWYSASWMAKALAVFRRHRVASAAAWSDQLFHKTHRAWLPTPRYYVLLFDSLLSGSVEIVKESKPYPDLRALTPGDTGPRFSSLPVSGNVVPSYQGEGYSYRSIEATASMRADGSVIRVMLFHDTSVLCSDEETLHDLEATPVSLRVRGLRPGRYRVTTYGIGAALDGNGPADRWIRWEEERQATSLLRPIFQGEIIMETGAGLLDLHPAGKSGPFLFPRHAVLFVELSRKGDS